jgi:hypothetical protein
MTSLAQVDDEKLVERLRSNAALPICPFDRRSPDYYKDFTDKPCPICGGLADGPDLCTGADTTVMREAASRLQALSEQARLHDAALSRLADYAEDIRKLSEENGRLREALTDIIPEAEDGCWSNVAAIARAALSTSAAGSEVSIADNSTKL